VKQVASVLGNTPAVCRKSYIHPAVGDAFLAGLVPKLVAMADQLKGLTSEEAAVLSLLKAA
jgi:DNA topoisomerase-1